METRVIHNEAIAKQIADMLLEMSGQIEQSIALVHDQCTETEFLSYRRAAAEVLASILDEFLNPLFKEHPRISPPELSHFYGKRTE
jgi:hypothetical protein